VGTPVGLACWNPWMASADVRDHDSEAYVDPPWRLWHSLRWLPDDDVRDVALADDGTLHFRYDLFA